MAKVKTYAGGAAGNRSLERGIEILRSFRPGVDTLGNGEIAERTGLPRSTVSRLTRTLVNSGMLNEAPETRAYRLAASVISLGHAVRSGSPVLNAIGPLMRAESLKRKLNVGLATADRTMMVYLESIRYSSRAALRNVVAGQQVPIELTSLGRAYLAGLGQSEREAALARLSRRNSAAANALLDDVRKSIVSVERHGYCAVSWQPGVLAVATPIVLEGFPIYALNMSTQAVAPTDALASEIGGYLVAFARKAKKSILDQQP